MELNESYWTNRYLSENVKWDIGYPSPPLVDFVQQLNDTNLKILIPGCGNAYEAEHLWQKKFKNIYLLDISEEPLRDFSERVPDFPEDQLLNHDFFKLEEEFDLILEQTFFCSLDPSLRPDYVNKMHDLLNEDGCLAGVLFDDPLNDDHPPFGGDEKEYRSLFEEKFDIVKMEQCKNSIPPRQGRELFILMKPLKSEE